MTTQTKILIAALGLTIVIGGGVAVVAYSNERRKNELLQYGIELQKQLLQNRGANDVSTFVIQADPSSYNKQDITTQTQTQTENEKSTAVSEETGKVSNIPPLRWTQSIIVLEYMQDPNNPALDEYNRRRRQQEKINSPVGQIYQGIRTALGLVPYIGPVITVLANLFDLIGENVVGGWNQGGWQNLSLSARKRITLYKLNTQFINNSPFLSQRYTETRKPTAPRPPGEQGISEQQYQSQLVTFQEEYSLWLRSWLIKTAIQAEFYRCSKTSDEAMLPAAVIDLLIESELWPPPIEPMPLTKAEWLVRRPDPASEFYIDWSVIDLSNPLTRRTYDLLRAEYEADARRFADAIRYVAQPAEIVALARKNGSIPQLGSPAAPLKAKSPL